MKNKYFNALIEFIKEHPNDYKKRLLSPPYNLKDIVTFPNNPNWEMFNYNLFESDLSNDIVRACRGTVVEVLDDGTVNIICAPYVKFFDINDVHADKINWDSKRLKTELKVDGQLIKMFKYKGRDYWVTNGGTGLHTPIDYVTEDVTNYKQLMAKALTKDVGQGCVYDDADFSCKCDWVSRIPDGWTLMFELTSPQNKIICKYDETKLWFHGVRDAEGMEHSPEEVKETFGIPYEIPKRFDLNKKEDILAALEKFNGEEQEGFVVVDEENWTRVKMKSPSYLALKYIREHDTPEGIWRLCMTESHDDYPDLKEKTDLQVKEINLFKAKLLELYDYANDVFENDKNRNRKNFALWVNEQVPNGLKSLYFNSIDKEKEIYLNDLWEKLKAKSGYDRYLSILGDIL